jgi:hypothetical protein
VTLVRSLRHPKGLLAPFEGNAQFLSNGHVFVGWGATAYYTEFDERGRVVLDARIGRRGPPGTEADTYRAYRFDWRGEPTDSPAIALSGGNLYVSWNGATEVTSWEVLAGSDPQQLSSSGTVPKSGFETAIPLQGETAYVAVRALAGDGRVLGTSNALKRRLG